MQKGRAPLVKYDLNGKRILWVYIIHRVDRDIGQIGELADKLSKETTESLKNIDVKLAYSIRNRIDHAYLTVKPIKIA